MSGDCLIQFGEEVLEQSDEKISKEKMYEVYCVWANENKKPILSKEQLGRRLNQKVTYLVAKKGSKERFWANVSLNLIWNNKFKNLSEDKNLKEKQDTLDTSPNITRKYSDIPNKDKKKDNKNNIYKVGESVESVPTSYKTDNEKIDKVMEDLE